MAAPPLYMVYRALQTESTKLIFHAASREHVYILIIEFCFLRVYTGNLYAYLVYIYA